MQQQTVDRSDKLVKSHLDCRPWSGSNSSSSVNSHPFQLHFGVNIAGDNDTIEIFGFGTIFLLKADAAYL